LLLLNILWKLFEWKNNKIYLILMRHRKFISFEFNMRYFRENWWDENFCI
jgi:hypothetical protein